MMATEPTVHAPLRNSFSPLRLVAPVDIASLAAFRILFGLLMTVAMVRFLSNGWVQQLYLTPRFHFPFTGLEWIQPMPAGWMQAHFVVLAILGLLIAAGCYYRIAITLFFFGFTYVELLDQTAYLNHYYLISLFSGLMIFLPANRVWSVDVTLRPVLRLQVIPLWVLFILRFQLAVVYIFAGIAKLNTDWLLHAQPLRTWLAARSDVPLIGSWLTETWVAFASSWFGAFYDLTIVFFLLHRRTRKTAFVAAIVFHVATWMLFRIGMFPWIMIIASTVFFAPDWPRRFVNRLFTRHADNLSATPSVWFVRHPRFVAAAVTLYVFVQIALPLRPYLLNRNHPAWTYRGFNFAWQVMVAEKTGYVEFFATDTATGHRTRIRPRDYITARQESLMAQDPYLIRALAGHIAANLNVGENQNYKITVEAFATLNGRPSQRVVDPRIDLASATGHGWVLPLQ